MTIYPTLASNRQSATRTLVSAASLQSLGLQRVSVSRAPVVEHHLPPERVSKRRGHVFQLPVEPVAEQAFASRDHPPLPAFDEHTRQVQCLRSASFYELPSPPREPLPRLPHSRHRATTDEDNEHSPLRDVPIDPRKARRYCTDFGLMRSGPAADYDQHLAPSPLSQQGTCDDRSIASAESTPLGTYYTGSESDTSSILEDFEFDFPEPPPISPILRRMKSSPLFTLDDTEEDRKIPERIRSETERHLAPAYSGPLDPSGRRARVVSRQIAPSQYSGRMEGLTKALELEGENLLRIDVLEHSQHRMRHVGTRDSGTFPTKHDVPFPRPVATSTPAKGHARAMSHGFPVASSSLADPARTRFATPRQSVVDQISVRGRLPRMRSLKFAPECNESLERLEVSMEKIKPQRSLLRGRSISMDFAKKSKKFPDLPVFTDARPKPSHRTNMSVPIFPSVDARAPPQAYTSRPYATPLLHRSTLGFAPTFERRTIPETPSSFRSFMDITPEEIEPEQGHRKKLRKLLARASYGVVGWGKALTRKASVSFS